MNDINFEQKEMNIPEMPFYTKQSTNNEKPKVDYSTFGIYMHIDMTPISISTSEIQVNIFFKSLMKS